MPTWLRHLSLSLCLILAGLATTASPVQAATNAHLPIQAPRHIDLTHPITLPPLFGQEQLRAFPHHPGFHPQAAFPGSLCANDQAYLIGFATNHGYQVGTPFTQGSWLRGNLYYLWCPANGPILNAWFPDGFNFAEATYTLVQGPCQQLVTGTPAAASYFVGRGTLNVASGVSLLNADYATVATSPPPRNARIFCAGQTLKDFSAVADGRRTYIGFVLYEIHVPNQWAGMSSWMATPYPR